jgi:hypothetical protein
MNFVRNYLGGNSIQNNAEAEEKKLKKNCPFLLQDGEKVMFAFLGAGGGGRDSTFFTDRRILERDVTGITGTSVKYRSTPYSTIKAYAVSTVGGGMDHDSELVVWATGKPRWEFEMADDKVDLFAVKRFLNSKVFPPEEAYKIVIPDGTSPGSSFQAQVAGQTMTVICPDNLEPGMTMEVVVPCPNTPYTSGPIGPDEPFSWMDLYSNDAKEVNPEELEKRLKSSPAVLAPEERVEIAFKCGKDFLILTSKRMLIVDSRGLTGKKVLYLSVLWKCARAFSVETADWYDRDCEIKIYTNIDDLRSGTWRCNECRALTAPFRGLPCPCSGEIEVGYLIAQDLRADKCDIMAVQRFFSDKILGLDSQPLVSGVDTLKWWDKDSVGQRLGAHVVDRYYVCSGTFSFKKSSKRSAQRWAKIYGRCYREHYHWPEARNVVLGIRFPERQS